MATIDLGKIKMTFRGTYNNSTSYLVDDVVVFTDTGVTSTYICKTNSTGNNPSSGGTAHANWAFMAKGVALSGSAHGDIPYFNGSSFVPLSAGTNGFFLKTQGSGAAPVWAALNEYDDSQVQNNIALLAFKIQTQESLAKFNLDDQIVDEFIDQTGVDTSTSTGEAFVDGGWRGVQGARNFWGNGSDGIGNITQNTNFVVPNTSGSFDGDTVIKHYTSLTINAGVTVSTAQPCRGLLIFVDGNCTLNGTISMRGKGPFADPTSAGGSDNAVVDSNGLRIPYLHSASSETLSSVSFAGMGTGAVAIAGSFPAISSNGKIFNIDRQGNSGGGSVSGSSSNGNAGGSGGSKTGGGGSGGAHDSGTSGPGSHGSCFGGGSAGGGARTGSGGTAVAFGGQGGSASGGASGSSGGMGNPHGTNHSSVTDGSSGDPVGTGGMVGLFVKGNLTIGAQGGIDCRGSRADTPQSEGGGGTSGSGAILIGYAGTLSNSGTVTVASVAGNQQGNGKGGAGGAGMTEIAQVDEAPGTGGNMTLVSNTITANAAPTKGDFIMQYRDFAGTNTINTDIKAYISRDNGSTFTQVTLVQQGTIASPIKLLSAHNVTLGGSATTNLKWKIETLNQSNSKSAKIDSVAIGWSS